MLAGIQLEVLGRFLLVTVTAEGTARLVGTAFFRELRRLSGETCLQNSDECTYRDPIGSKRLFPWLGKWPPTEKTNSRFASAAFFIPDSVLPYAIFVLACHF